jgi:copper resistance protein B
MRRLLLFAAATIFTGPALAQHHGHHPPGHAMPKAKPTPKVPPAAKKPAPKKPSARPPAKKRAAPPSKKALSTKPPETAVPHAGHRLEAAPPPASADHPHAGHDMGPAPAPADPHAGHASPVQPADPHAGHAMPGTSAVPAPPVAPPPPEAFQGPENAAETIYDPELFRRQRQEELIDEHGGMRTWMFLADQLEYRIRDGRDGYRWDVQGWYGGDYDRLWLKSEGEGEFGRNPEQAEVQGLYSRSIDPWFNLQAGLRHDFRPDPERTHLVVGVQGLAPYWFEVEGQLFLSDRGDLTARAEAEYDQRISNRLILQPAVELNASLQDVPEIGLGSGLSTVEAALRLRYELVPEFAPYLGVEYERAFGDTADFRRSEGEEAGAWAFLAGIRLWF